MGEENIRRMRIIHTVILSLFIVVTLVESVQGALPYWEYILAIGFVAAWMLGIRYERTVVIDSGLVDPVELKEAERRGSQWIDWENIMSK